MPKPDQNWLDQFILPHTEAFHEQCMKYIVHAYVMLRDRRGVAELQAKLPADMFQRLEAEAQERAKVSSPDLEQLQALVLCITYRYRCDLTSSIVVMRCGICGMSMFHIVCLMFG